MALPVSTPPPPQDIAVNGWAGITVRVAWALLEAGVKVRTPVLRAARDHVLYHLPANTTVPVAEDRAASLTRAFVATARHRPLPEFAQDAAMPLSPRWRKALEDSLTPLTRAILRLHYADGRPLEHLVRILQVDRVTLEGARGGLREVVRRMGANDGLELDGWSGDRVDALLGRLAAFATGPCPKLQEVIEGKQVEHVKRCTRCDRAQRMILGGVLGVDDLLPPVLGARPSQHARVLALHFHPDGRHHRARILREADLPCFPVGDDLLLMDGSEPEAAHALVVLAAEVGAPHRDHLRGAVLEGPGRWSRYGLIGPLVDEARHVVRSRSWGTVETLGELPAPLPDPPSARVWWAVAVLLLLVSGFGLRAATSPSPLAESHQLQVDFSNGRGGVWTDFDVAEDALVTLVREADQELDVVLSSQGAFDKADYATGDGRYRLHTLGPGVLIAASSEPLDDLEPMLGAAQTAGEPLDDLAERIRAAHPTAEIRTWVR